MSLSVLRRGVYVPAMRRPGRHLALAGALAGALACAPASAPLERPTPTPPGTPSGDPSSATLSQPGGTLASADGRLTLTIPEGAIASAVPFSIQPITNEAPGGVGSAYRLGPEGASFVAPVRLTFDVGASAALEDLAVAHQDAQGYWVHVGAVSRDPEARTLTVLATHFSDWTLVNAPSALDLHGSFTLDSTMGVPVTVDGIATLTYGGSDETTRLYLLSGTAEIPATIADGGTTCTPEAPHAAVEPLNTNFAEMPAGQGVLWWGTTGHFGLACVDGTTRFLDVLFDTYGIYLLRCLRVPGAEVVGPDRAEGTYAIDCGVDGSIVATWSFSAERCGTECTPAAPVCHAGRWDCATGTAICVDTGAFASAGTPCGMDHVCTAAGECAACVDGGPCPASDPCRATGTLSCAAGPACTDGAPLPPGTPCGSNLVCDPAGACSPCLEYQACVPANPCDLGQTSCATGVQLCVDSGIADPAAAGTACTRGDGTTGTCSAGACI